ncbi:MAG: hypothetical protein RL134_595 [Actinomycetota bacterium]
MPDSRRRPLSFRRIAIVAGGIGAIWCTVALFTLWRPVDLSVALLVVLVQVLAIAVFAGPVLSLVAALSAVILVNWYLVPPYGTFEIASAGNVVTLVVFGVMAVVAATLVEIGARGRQAASEAARRTELLSEIVMVGDSGDTAQVLERVRIGLGWDYVELRGVLNGKVDGVLARSGMACDSPSVDIPLSEGYRLAGHGVDASTTDPDFVLSLGSAAVRAYESEQLAAETQRAEQLAAIDRARTALLASVGHDLRTPLASLRLSVDALRSPAAGLREEDRRTLLDTIAVSTERLDDFIANLLDMSRLQAGVVVARIGPMDVADVVDRAELVFASDRVIVDLPRALPKVAADPALLERMVANLISNALRYSPISQPVEVTARSTDACVVLAVSDRGPGLEAAEAEDVFTAFHGVGAQSDGGSGLGLAIVKGFAEAMGVDVALRARAEGGLAAEISIPTWSERA